MHPTQHSTIRRRTASDAAREMTHGLIELSHAAAAKKHHLAPLSPNTHELLSQAAKQSQPFRVRPAPMPQTAA